MPLFEPAPGLDPQLKMSTMNEWPSARIGASITGLVSVYVGLLLPLHELDVSVPVSPCMTRTNSLATSPSVEVPVGFPFESVLVVTLPLMMMLLAAAVVTGVV